MIEFGPQVWYQISGKCDGSLVLKSDLKVAGNVIEFGPKDWSLCSRKCVIEFGSKGWSLSCRKCDRVLS